MNKFEYLGYAAGILTTVAFIPQAWKVLKSRQTRDISMAWAVTMVIGVFFWLCYGISMGSMPMMLANGITLVLLSLILWVKIGS